MRAVFLDRDGTTIVDPPDLRVDKMEKLKLFEDTISALQALAGLDYEVFLVTNQAGIAEGRLDGVEFKKINDKFIEMVAESGVKIIKTYMCPHAEADGCDCKKPKPGMLLQAAKDYDINLKNSWMIGDRQSDILAGVAAGTKTILVKTGNVPVVSAEATFTAATLTDAIKFITSQSRD